MHQLKLTIREKNQEQQSLAADSVYAQLSPSLQRCVDLARESGSSSWLTVLPIEEYAFYLHEGDFRDALSLRYVDHAMNCPYGGFPVIRHNKVRDLTATLLT